MNPKGFNFVNQRAYVFTNAAIFLAQLFDVAIEFGRSANIKRQRQSD